MNLKQLFKEIEDQTVRLSFSSLKNFAKSPEHFVEYKTKKPPPTDAMRFGAYAHAIILDPDSIAERFVCGIDTPTTPMQNGLCESVIEFIRTNSKKGAKEWSDELIDYAFLSEYAQVYKKGTHRDLMIKLKDYIIATLKGKEVVSPADVVKAEHLKERIFENKVSSTLLNKVQGTEYGVEWKSYNGYPMIGYLDGYGEDFVFDLKITDAEPEPFARQFFKMKWYVQAAMYMDAMQLNGKAKQKYFIVAIDVKGNVSVHEVSNDYLVYGLNEYKLWLQDFAKCTLQRKFNANYEFYGRKGDKMFDLPKPYYAKELMPVWDDNE